MLRPYRYRAQPQIRNAMRPVLFLLIVLAPPLAAQEPFDFYSRGPYRPAVPRPEAITGYAAGEQHTMYAVMQHYLDTLVATASDRVLHYCVHGVLLAGGIAGDSLGPGNGGSVGAAGVEVERFLGGQRRRQNDQQK